MNNEFKFEFLLLRQVMTEVQSNALSCLHEDRRHSPLFKQSYNIQYAFQLKEHRCLISLPDKKLDQQC